MGLPVLVNSGFECDDARLAHEITLLTTQINVANYRLLKLIAEFDSRGAWRRGGTLRSCAHWLAARCGVAIGAAREKVRVARRLASLPEVEQAFATGELSYSKVRAITRVATEANEGFLVMMAERASASYLEKLVGKYKPVDEFGLEGFAAGDGAVNGSDGLAGDGLMKGVGAAADGSGGVTGDGLGKGALGATGDGATIAGSSGVAGNGQGDGAAGAVGGSGAVNGAAAAAIDEESRREQARELYWFQDKDGMWIIHAKLPPEQGQLVMKALEAVARPIQEERQEEWKAKQKAQLQAVARHITRRHREAGLRDVCGDEEIERANEKISAETFSQFMNHVRADAFANLAEHFLATAGSYPQLQGLKGAERCQVVLHVDINTLREQRAGLCCSHGRAHFEDKPWLSPQTARRLSCDASLVTVLEDEHGKVLNVGRRSRLVPAAIRRALMERDGVCQYPGCHESRHVDAHHIRHWADGGETSLENLVTLCRFHHRQLHRGCFDVKVEDVSAEISAEGSGNRRLVFTQGQG